MSDGLEGRRYQLAHAAYQNAGREITQAFSTLNFNTALAAGVLATVLGTLGAGELFAPAPEGGPASNDAVPTLSVVSNFVLALSAPLLIRFFIRTMLGYQNLIRFNRIQRAAWDYMAGNLGWAAFSYVERMYGSVDEWRSPMSLRRLIKSNLEYGFFWVFMALLIPLVWSYISIWELATVRWVSLGIVSVAFIWELILFLTHRLPFFNTLSAKEKAHLAVLESCKTDRISGELLPGIPVSSPVVEEVRGLFLGRRRLFDRT